MPMFNRVRFSDTVYLTWEFKQPQGLWIDKKMQRGVDLYSQFWSKYINDVYHDDSRELEVYMLLYAHEIDELMRSFLLYNNSLFVIAKITDIDMASNEKQSVKVNLIKVRSRYNYI